MVFSFEGAQMYYETAGSGDRILLLLHGWGGSTESWIPVVRDFQSDFRVIAVDFPGFGKSPEPENGWSVEEYAKLIETFIRSLNVPKVDLIAHSFGGRVALAVNRDMPDSIGKQVLTGCAGLRPAEDAKPKFSARVIRFLSELAEKPALRAIFGEKRLQSLRNRLRNHFGSADYKNASPLMKETFQKVVKQDLSECLPRVKASTLLIWGENDTATPLWMGRQMEKDIRDAGLVVFENCGHFAYLEQYARFQTVTKKFLLG